MKKKKVLIRPTIPAQRNAKRIGRDVSTDMQIKLVIKEYKH
jgi:hypothetical protein